MIYIKNSQEVPPMIRINLLEEARPLYTQRERAERKRKMVRKGLWATGIAVVSTPLVVLAVMAFIANSGTSDAEARAPVRQGIAGQRREGEKPSVPKSVPIKYIKDDRADPPVCFAIYTETNAMVLMPCRDIPEDLFSK